MAAIIAPEADSLNKSATMFGRIDRLSATHIQSGQYRFCLADIALDGRSSTSPLADVALRLNEHSPLAERHNAPWVRGRVQRVFGFTDQPNDLGIESRVDDSMFTDRLMLNVSFAAQTLDRGTTIYIPFICTEEFSESCLIHGTLPERNSDKYHGLVSSMTHSFVSLLMADSSLDDYDDYGVVFGSRFSFGVRNGIPYNYFPGTHP
jgi:hypothetical protein